jgi:hypothetical protein
VLVGDMLDARVCRDNLGIGSGPIEPHASESRAPWASAIG